jgi:hypothetical protein
VCVCVCVCVCVELGLSVFLMEEHRFKVYKNKAEREIFVPNKQRVARLCRNCITNNCVLSLDVCEIKLCG